MCMSIPRRVIAVSEGRAEVLVEGRVASVACLAMPDLTVGDYVLLHADAAIERLGPAEAHQALALFADIAALMDDPAAVDLLLHEAALAEATEEGRAGGR